MEVEDPVLSQRWRGAFADEWLSERDVRSRRQSHPSEKKPGDRRIPSPYEASSTRMFHPHVHQRTTGVVWLCACARVCSRLASLFLNLEACGRVYASGSRDLARKEREGWAAGTLEGLLFFYVGWTWTCPTGQRSPRSRNQFNDRPWSEAGMGGGKGRGSFLDDTGAGLTWASRDRGWWNGGGWIGI